MKPFLESFFPNVARHLDLSSPEFVDKELFEDPPEGSHRVADLVARVASRDGDPELVLIHVEVQADRKHDIPARMFDYYALLRRVYRVPVVPLVVYLRGGGEPLHREEYRDVLFGMDTLVFRYHSLVLAQLDADQHVSRDEALLAGLAALMDRSKARKPLRLRLSMLNRIGKSPYDDYRKFLLTNLVEVYFELGDNDVERFERVLSRPEFKEAREMAISHVEKLLEQGREEGREEGREQGHKRGLIYGKQESLVRLMEKKFGVLPDEVLTRVRALSSAESLDELLEAGAISDMDIPSG